jgi:hypothetical protein
VRVLDVKCCESRLQRTQVHEKAFGTTTVDKLQLIQPLELHHICECRPEVILEKRVKTHPLQDKGLEMRKPVRGCTCCEYKFSVVRISCHPTFPMVLGVNRKVHNPGYRGDHACCCPSVLLTSEAEVHACNVNQCARIRNSDGESAQVVTLWDVLKVREAALCLIK